jgi:hypothetical protein
VRHFAHALLAFLYRDRAAAIVVSRLIGCLGVEAVFGPVIEVVQSSFFPLLGCSRRLVGRVACTRRTALIIPPLEIVTLARAIWSFAHVEAIRRAAGFLMSNAISAVLIWVADALLLFGT